MSSTTTKCLSVLLSFAISCKDTPSKDLNADQQLVTKNDAELRHKIECARFEKDQQDKAEQNQTGLLIVDSVFYSSKENSCLVAKHMLWYPKYDSGRDPEDLEIDDLLDGGKQIFYYHSNHAQDAATLEVMMEKTYQRT